MENQNHTHLIWPVQSPYKIAYRDPLTGFLTLLPYIDLQWKIKIWGIAIGQMVFKLTHEAGTDWNTAMTYTDLCRGTVPTTAELDIAFAHKSGFNELVQLLRSKNVVAEPWNDGWYWSNENNGDTATVIDMADGKAELIPKRIKNGYVRLLSRRIATDKPLSVRYPLVYLEDGVFKISYDLDLSRKEQLWGIQLGKKYFCLCQEPTKQTWYQAVEKAKELSTDLVRISLPKKEMFDEPAKYRDSINDALMKLRAYGVKVDLWEDKSLQYLTSSEYLDHYVTWWHEMIPKDIPKTCRFIGENRKHGTILI
ncbi:MAG: hypothetical protein IJ218_05640 [Alphaproteobacteria bacterium]|nr:hypothetical protein [Alphaproteobacteria bacterium]